MGCSSSKSSTPTGPRPKNAGAHQNKTGAPEFEVSIEGDRKHSSVSTNSEKSVGNSSRFSRNSDQSNQQLTEEHVINKIKARKAVFSKGFIDVLSDDDRRLSKPLGEVIGARKKTPKTKSEMKSIIQSLCKCYLFADSSTEQLTELAEFMWKENVAPGSTVIEQGSSGSNSDNFYVIQSGTFEFFQDTKLVDTRSGKGSTPFFGELALMYNAPRAATVKCLKASSKNKEAAIWAIDRATFRHIIATNSLKNRVEFQNAVESVPLLRDNLTTKQLDCLVDSIQLINMKCGQRIVKKGKKGDVCYFIKEGKVVCSKIGDQGLGSIELGPGSYFGERALLTDEPRAADVYAKQAGVLMALDRKSFNELLGPLRSVMDTNMKERVIEALPILNQLSKSDRKKVLSKFEVVEFKNGETIVKQGDTGDKFYIVRSGEVVVCANKGTLTTLKAGNWFGEMALINDHPRAATCEAKGNVECFALSKHDFKTLHKSSPLLVKTSEKRYRENEKKHGLLSPKTVKKKSMSSRKSSKERKKSKEPEKPKQIVKIKSETPPSSPKHVPRAVASYNLNKLEKLKVLGKGTFGTVFLTKSPDQKLWALKMMNKMHLLECEQTKNVLNEKAVLTETNHPFILELAQTFKDRDSLYMLLEFVQGGELFTIMQKRFRLPVPDSRFYAACIVDAFDYLHNLNIVYRDLKPENILIGKDGFVKIADFGFAKQITSKTFTLCGTPEYLAPEVVLGKGHDKGVDYWGIGILVFEMLVGISPFADVYDDDQMIVCKNIVNGRVDFEKLTKSVAELEGKSPKSATRNGTLAVDLVSKLLVKNSHKRLGCLKDGAVGVKHHEFFSTTINDWEDLRNKNVDAPFIPKVSGPLDTSNFDEFEPDETWPAYKGSQSWCANF